MRNCWLEVKNRVERWVRDYDSLQYLALIFLYIQIGCALIGSLGALYNGVLMINLAIALFALVAIESSSQSLGRTYAVLLSASILLDVFWFIFFSHDIWNISPDDNNGALFIFSVKLTLAMQILGFSVRFLSSFLWIQIYRLGVYSVEHSTPHDVDYDLRNSFLSPVTPAAAASSALPRQCSDSDVVLGGSIYDPAYYSSLFEDARHTRSLNQNQSPSIVDNGSTSSSDAPLLKVPLGRSFESIDEENTELKPQNG